MFGLRREETVFGGGLGIMELKKELRGLVGSRLLSLLSALQLGSCFLILSFEPLQLGCSMGLQRESVVGLCGALGTLEEGWFD
jgi:hypothetical protein